MEAKPELPPDPRSGSKEAHAHRDPSKSRANIAFLIFAAIAAFVLLVEHRAHAFGLLPYLLLLACPLLHLFHHRGHRHGAADKRERGPK